MRVFQRFSTLDAVSNGRAEVILGRGSFTESFPLFGFDLPQYEQLFEEKLDLFAAAAARRSRSPGRARRAPPLDDQRGLPADRVRALKTWVGVGGSPESVVRAARYGLPLMLAIIGGDPRALRAVRRPLPPRARRVRAAPSCRSACTRPATSPTPTSRRARSCGRTTRRMRDRIGAERGWPPMQPRRSSSGEAAARRALRRLAGDRGARRSRATVAALGLSRFDLKYSAGTLPHEQLMTQHRALRHRGRAAARALCSPARNRARYLV